MALCVGSNLPAQSPTGGVTVFGRVQDAQSKLPLPFLTVQLLRERDSTFVAGRLTDTTGAFTFTGLAKGVYLLDARRIGLRRLFCGGTAQHQQQRHPPHRRLRQ